MSVSIKTNKKKIELQKGWETYLVRKSNGQRYRVMKYDKVKKIATLNRGELGAAIFKTKVEDKLFEHYEVLIERATKG